MDGVPLTIERLIQVQVERFGVTQTSATIISTSHWLWFQVYYSTPKPHAILLSLLFSPDQNKQVSAHLCITTVRYRNIPTHSTRSSKTVLTVKRSVFTNISFLCLSPLDFSIIGKIFRVSRSPLLYNEILSRTAEYLRDECPENHFTSCTTNPLFWMTISPPLQTFVIFLHFSSDIPKSLEKIGSWLWGGIPDWCPRLSPRVLHGTVVLSQVWASAWHTLLPLPTKQPISERGCFSPWWFSRKV